MSSPTWTIGGDGGASLTSPSMRTPVRVVEGSWHGGMGVGSGADRALVISMQSRLASARRRLRLALAAAIWLRCGPEPAALCDIQRHLPASPYDAE